MLDYNIVRNQIAIFNLLGALFKEAMGKKPIVSILVKDGNAYKVLTCPHKGY